MEKREYLQNEKNIIQKGKSLWNKQQYLFYFIGTLNMTMLYVYTKNGNP